MKFREFIYTGEPVPEIAEQEYALFYLQLKKAMLASLRKRGFLTDSQYDGCIGKLEKQDRSGFHVNGQI